MTERFGKDRRLLKRADFLRVQRDGVAARSQHYVVLSLRRNDLEPARLGVVASRKVGSAVLRNRGKRHVREWYRKRLGASSGSAGELPPGVDIEVILRAGAPALSFESACTELDDALRRSLAKTRRKAPLPADV